MITVIPERVYPLSRDMRTIMMRAPKKAVAGKFFGAADSDAEVPVVATTSVKNNELAAFMVQCGLVQITMSRSNRLSKDVKAGTIVQIGKDTVGVVHHNAVRTDAVLYVVWDVLAGIASAGGT